MREDPACVLPGGSRSWKPREILSLNGGEAVSHRRLTGEAP
jgi:hypothetical protein